MLTHSSTNRQQDERIQRLNATATPGTSVPQPPSHHNKFGEMYGATHNHRQGHTNWNINKKPTKRNVWKYACLSVTIIIMYMRMYACNSATIVKSSATIVCVCLCVCLWSPVNANAKTHRNIHTHKWNNYIHAAAVALVAIFVLQLHTHETLIKPTKITKIPTWGTCFPLGMLPLGI